ncbi:quinol oxidase [Telmatospirillum sp. J64-1]|uniref:quinol oxidase n=1 Tax=Telmatospirillum sp. J64-1 TaxID=2502183 RepID=UPI00115EC710|nr:quinol oxidase [Telmatospirillum sp. J64-1]
MADLLRTRWDQLAAAFVLAAGLGLFAAMPLWRWAGAPPQSRVAAIDVAEFEQRVEDFVAAHGTGEVEDGLPVVAPPPGEVPVIARRWQFYPALRLEAGQRYELHVASTDILHGFALEGAGADLLLPGGSAGVVTLVPQAPGRLAIQCSEYCGIEHNRMRAWVEVVGPQ